MDELWKQIVTDAFGIGWVLSGAFFILCVGIVSVIDDPRHKDIFSMFAIIAWLLVVTLAFAIK